VDESRLLQTLQRVDELGEPGWAFLEHLYDAAVDQIGFGDAGRRSPAPASGSSPDARSLRDARATAYLRRLAPVAAIAALAVAGLALLNVRQAGVGGPSASASPTPSRSPAPSASPTAWWSSDVCGACVGVLPAGTHTSTYTQPAVTYTVPAGWVNNYDHADGFQLLPDTATNRSLVESNSQTVYYLALLNNVRVAAADCSNSAEAGVGFSADELVSALTRRPGLNVGTPVPVTVGGVTGKQIDLEVAREWTITCAESHGLPAVPTVANGDAHWWAVFSERKRVIVLDDPDGGNIYLEVAGPTDGFDSHLAASMAIIETLKFGSQR
jgi:hypothetical protein